MRPIPYLLSVLALLGSACHRQQPTYESVRAGGGAPRLDEARIVDLTYAYDRDTIYWPTSPASFELEELAHGRTEAGFFYSANAFSTPEHGGTHLDAPIHFSAGSSAPPW